MKWNDEQKKHCLIISEGTALTYQLAKNLLDDRFDVTLLKFPERMIKEKYECPETLPLVLLRDMSESSLQLAFSDILNRNTIINGIIHLNPVNTSDIFSENEKIIAKHLFLTAKYFTKSLKTSQYQNIFPFFMSVVRMNGQLGVDCHSTFGVIPGGISGLIKSLKHEWNEIFCRFIDLSPEIDIESAASHIYNELHDADRKLIEVGYTLDSRYTLATEKAL